MGKSNQIDGNDQYCVPKNVAKRFETQKTIRSRIKRRYIQTSAPKSIKRNNVEILKKQRKMKKKEKKKLKKEAKKRENTSTEEKDRSICQMNCKVHTFMIKHRLNKKNQEPPIKLNFCRKKDTPSGYLNLPKIQQPQYLKKLYYSLFLTENSNPESTRYSTEKTIKEESISDPYPIPHQPAKKFCNFCKQYFFQYQQHIQSENHLHNWTKDNTFNQVKRKVQQYSKLLKKDFRQYNNLQKSKNKQSNN